MMVASTIQVKLVLKTGGTGKKAFEEAGSVSIQYLLCKTFYLATVHLFTYSHVVFFRLLLNQYPTYARW